MTKEQKQLLALVYLAIHPDVEVPKVLKDDISWELVLDESNKQSLIGVAYFGIRVLNAARPINGSNSFVSKSVFTEWYLLSEKIREDNLRVNRRTAQLCSNLSKNGFRVSVMKGQGNALLYSKELSLLRSSGDIDIWVEGGFQRVYDFVMKISPTTHVSEKDLKFDVFSDTEVEVHYRPLVMRNPFKNRRLQVFFNSQAEACFSNRVKLQTQGKDGEVIMEDVVITTTCFNLIHQLAHIHRHLFAVGMGLRHMMDYYFQLIHAEKTMNQEEKEEVVRVVKSIGLERLAKAVSWILSEHFGLPQSCLLWAPNKEDGEILLEDILRTGNFGSGDESLMVGIRSGGLNTLLNVLKHNLILSRFDKTDWFWGPINRTYYYFWRKIHGFTR